MSIAHCRRGFSLIETIVVIGVILVLASLSLSALVAARGHANTAVVSSNLRQIGTAMKMYADQYDLDEERAIGQMDYDGLDLVLHHERALLESPLDPTREGFGTRTRHLAISHSESDEPAFRYSLLSRADLLLTKERFSSACGDQPLGWLMTPTFQAPASPRTGPVFADAEQGSLLLMPDSSVVHHRALLSVGKKSVRHHVYSLFTDVSDSCASNLAKPLDD